MVHILVLLSVFVIGNGVNPDYKVFVTKNKNEAHLWVWKTNRRFDSREREEIWFQTNLKYQSDFTVRLVNSRQRSDLVIYFVNNRNLAGWRRNHPLKNNLRIQK